jgi:hypothetical protein
MMSFLTYITEFFMNFEILPILCLYSSNLGTFWLKIEQFWPFEEISIFSYGGHLGYRSGLTDTKLTGDHLRIISAKFEWPKLLYFKPKSAQIYRV